MAKAIEGALRLTADAVKDLDQRHKDLFAKVTALEARIAALEGTAPKTTAAAGGPEAFRQSLVDKGYGHVSVKDEELGGKSYVGLSPETFRLKQQ